MKVRQSIPLPSSRTYRFVAISAPVNRSQVFNVPMLLQTKFPRMNLVRYIASEASAI